MTSSNTKAWNKKYTLLNNLGSKHSLVIKFGQFMSYYDEKIASKTFTKNMPRKLVPDFSEFIKN